MEPVTHILTGACLARTGLNRRAAYTTLTMAVAAQFPDIDTLWSLRGPVEGFQHHRGITHTFLGLPFEAAFIVGCVYGLHRWRVARAAKKPPTSKPLTVAPIRWGLLYGFALIALLSHLLLDFTNNYGLRPFFPFDRHWYAGSFVFIFDPLIFLLLVGALAAPALFGLISSEVGAKRKVFRGRGWAVAALLGIVSLWTLRATQHARALELAGAQNIAAPAAASPATVQNVDEATPAPADAAPVFLTARNVLASPDMLNPFLWYASTDFGAGYQLAEVDTRTGTVAPEAQLIEKPGQTPAILTAEASPLGRAYMDWSMRPVVTEVRGVRLGTSRTEDLPPGTTVLTFTDTRFMRGLPVLSSSARSALTATVTLDAAGHIVEQRMDGRVER